LRSAEIAYFKTKPSSASASSKPKGVIPLGAGTVLLAVPGDEKAFKIDTTNGRTYACIAEDVYKGREWLGCIQHNIAILQAEADQEEDDDAAPPPPLPEEFDLPPPPMLDAELPEPPPPDLLPDDDGVLPPPGFDADADGFDSGGGAGGDDSFDSSGDRGRGRTRGLSYAEGLPTLVGNYSTSFSGNRLYR
jgi:hypothetical protein